ncbi:DUF3592 domain-containing protein [Pseudoalteromonas sp.]|uniref:DUF3592 domain-containing protein n=1 Tax=Pseudoalteromonas sp. TaxID=53249 RepID=UPI0035699D2E
MDYLPRILISIGIGIIILLTYAAIRGYKSKKWRSTKGILLDKGTQVHISKALDSNVITWKSTHIALQYEYEVAGETYRSTRATFSDMVNKPKSSLDLLLNEYAEHDYIVVYYNPANYQDSVLFPGISIWNITPMLTGVLFIAAGVYIS